jgi:methylenetetrahydrofolate dehydrogenase (NADP+)/methenyltetrahydrofolate cyclohydrolase
METSSTALLSHSLPQKQAECVNLGGLAGEVSCNSTVEADDSRCSSLSSDVAHHYCPENYDSTPGLVDDGARGRLLDGRAVAAEVAGRVRIRIQAVQGQIHLRRSPGLTVILIGGDDRSRAEVRQKDKLCIEVGIRFTLLALPANTTPERLTALIERLNEDPTCDGISIQLALTEGVLVDEWNSILETIRADKDAEGLHPYNVGCLATREPTLRPCLPFGIMHLIWSTGVNPYGLECVVVGASNRIGRPMMLELLLNGASVRIVHRFSKNLESAVRSAECLVVASGKPELVKGEWIRPGAIVIDTGKHVLPDGQIVGDVEFDAARERAGWITSVTEGVSHVELAMLLRNVVSAWDIRNDDDEYSEEEDDGFVSLGASGRSKTPLW